MNGRATLLFLLASLSGCAGQRLYLRPVPDAEAVGVFHTVREGETFWAICRAYRADPQEVAEINGLEDPALLQPGQQVFIPDAEREVHPGPAAAPPTEENIEVREKGRFVWPVAGSITSRFGIRAGRRHDGIDIAAPEGTPIVAAADGEVLYSGDQKTGYGNLIIVRHAGDFITVYAHNSENLVREGEQVKQGQAIARVGQTGRATGPHLHFEMREGVKPRNPLFFLPRSPEGAV